MADENKRINTPQVLGYLNHAFAEALKEAAPVLGVRNTRGTDLYNYQVEFCYLVDDIKRGPNYIVPKAITQANELIAEIRKLKK